jgi:uncharacterized phosphosugar-binding protein
MTDTVDLRYLDRLLERLQWIRDNQHTQISQAAEICADSIASDGLVFSFGTGHGSFYASPTVLASLRAGTTLDVDPVTGIRTTVAYADDAVVQIVEESNAERKTFVYDRRSGWLLQYVIEQNIVTGSTTVRYDLSRVE